MLPPNIEDYENAEDYNKDYNYWEHIQKQQKQLLKEEIEDNALILISVISIIIILIGILTSPCHPFKIPQPPQPQ